MTREIVTRFAPSPTGLLHIGNTRTALISWLFAKSNNGKFILRIDDTDQSRSKPEYEDAIKRDLEWLGLEWQSIFKQSERMDLYQNAKEKLISSGRLYKCYESQAELELKKKGLIKRGLPPIYDRASLKLSEKEKSELESNGVKPHWRFMLDSEDISWVDLVRGEMHFQASKISDPILFKEDGNMTYTLASVVDDIDLGITHIIRGEDHLTNSATHLQIFKALCASTMPTMAHLSLLASKDGEISKRLGGFDIDSLREDGIEAIAINTFLAKIGSSDSVECCYSLDELAQSFDMKKFSRSTVNYDFEELKRFNIKTIHHMSFDSAKGRLNDLGLNDISEEFWNAVKGNIEKISDIREWYEICYGEIAPNKELDTIVIKTAVDSLSTLEWCDDIWIKLVDDVKNKTGKKGKELFLPIRLALTGHQSGPEMRSFILFIGKEKVISRLENCIS